MAQDLQPSTAAGFQQQGTVDWTRVLSGSVTFSVDVLSQLSKAGVEAFTVYAARAIFSNVKIGPNGELRLHRALDKLTAFPSFDKVLWFGFGVKHLIWTMQESREGLNCLGICACLTEGYGTPVAAKIIRELFLLYDPPSELAPALRQWHALVESSGGLLASSEFGLVLHGLTKLCLVEGRSNLRDHGSPKDIALVLKEVFEVSAGRLNRVFMSGGADCAWVAAVAHWLLDLRVEVQNQDGTIIYRPDGTRSNSSPDTQVIITYYQDLSSEIVRVSRKHYVIPSGTMLFGHIQIGHMMPYGRVSWENCLVDTFGSPMRLLLGSQARLTGACLGSAARILLANMRGGEGHMDLSQTHGWEPSPISESSYGRGFHLLARRLLPELGQNPVLHKTMEVALNKESLDAARQFSQSYASLGHLCYCKSCYKNTDDERETTDFCLLILIPTICTLIRTMSAVNMQQDLQVLPTRSGLESLYWVQEWLIGSLETSDYDPIIDGLLRWPKQTLELAQILFAGRRHNSDWNRGNNVAVSYGGLCFCLNTLVETTTDPQSACVLTVVPGKIEWNGFMYGTVRDLKASEIRNNLETAYDAVSMTTVTKYDDLAHSSTPGLNAELVVEEALPESDTLSAMYQVSVAAFPGRYFSIKPAEIWKRLNLAYTAASCEGKRCDSLNGFQSLLVKGEGSLRITTDWQNTRLPIVRVLSTRDVSVWVALSQRRNYKASSVLNAA
ncbi:hypothetical protein FPRO03_02895 [Fusarium proliferatum]|nr:hypothetical protein FPRO03_02895 [Fusarium proliferatum]